jgi:DNA repair protein RecN (Recombination protein N)
MQTLTHQFQQKALALRASRQLHAETLCAEISATIQQLAIPKGYVTMVFTALENPQPHGLDKVEYHVCTNPGMPLQPLTKIASGGELSRISLAIQMITAQRASTPTLLFDEVDVGIGGTTAALVGQLLRALGERLQVFCVTHQPQVAAFAHNHYKVTKETLHEQTYSHIEQLDQSQQIDELARMLGGLVITEQTRSHARELLAQNEMTHAV